MNSADSYLVLESLGTSEIKVKGSRFLGFARSVPDEATAEALLAEIRKRERDARHHCFAWRFGIPGPVPYRTRSSDDGEPSGTAGRPMLQLLEGRCLTNSLVVVTRYFGGTLLGTGGLLHAYSDAARSAIEAAGTKEVLIEDRYELRLGFSNYNPWMMEIARMGARVEHSEFTDQVAMTVAIRRSKAGLLVPSFVQCTKGKGEVRGPL